ncbi:hypothetical protein [Rubritalea marina]|uniref:hypothetical protein n=1 Tax=Rubritalea marina TaxID=361055 RepID=UPI00036C06D6|nr:hypothetical protein [Rubritalea marina]
MNYDDAIASLPHAGLRDGQSWLFSPKPFSLSKRELRKIKSLGHVLSQFQRASDSLYQRSKRGSVAPWVAQLLDAGKPEWMLQQQSAPEFQELRPRVIRPDLILTDDGFALTELDSVPGGMGITTWLSQLYTEHGFDVVGGRDGMPEGFKKLMPEGGRILVSEESADYRPEMEWLASQLGEGFRVETAETAVPDGSDAYRFFEWFDWENISAAKDWAAQANLTSPCKPHLEEKLWLALLWSPALRPLWEGMMRHSHLNAVRDVVPFSWVIDPQPLPPHAALPRLDVHSWDEVAQLSQKQRELVVKISGFSELAWGSKSVAIGHDMSKDDWQETIDTALEQHGSQPWLMQEFHAGRVVEHPYFDAETGEVKLMQGRVRLCPYYFTDRSGYTELSGILATIVPSDKKKIHGMKDGILVPCMLEE